MVLTAAERALVHLYDHWDRREPSPEMTQEGIARGAGIGRSHVPRAVRRLLAGGWVEEREGRIKGRGRKVRLYVLTESGVRRAREILTGLRSEPVRIEGTVTTFEDACKTYGLRPVDVARHLGTGGELRLPPAPLALPSGDLVERDGDLRLLTTWFRRGPPVLVVYASRGMGKTALARAFAATFPSAVAWLDLSDDPSPDRVVRDLGGRAGTPVEEAFASRTKGSLVVLDGYGEVSETVVDATRRLVRAAGPETAKLLVLAQQDTPSYCRFTTRDQIDGGEVQEHRLRGLSAEGCRRVLGRPDLSGEPLRQIFLLTKGTPRHLVLIREGDARGLREHSRFTPAEIRLLLYSRDAKA